MVYRNYLPMILALMAAWLNQLSSFVLRRLAGAGPMVELSAGVLLGLSMVLGSVALRSGAQLGSNS